jgi:hypothetical protein
MSSLLFAPPEGSYDEDNRKLDAGFPQPHAPRTFQGTIAISSDSIKIKCTQIQTAERFARQNKFLLAGKCSNTTESEGRSPRHFRIIYGG